MKKKIISFFLGTIPFVVVFVVWLFASSFGWLPRWAIPSPGDTFLAGWNALKDGTLPNLVWLSALNILPAYLVAAVLAIGGGILCGNSPLASKMIRPFLSAFYPIPSLAWLPLIILFFGLTRTSVWILIIVATFTRMIYSIIGGTETIREEWLMTARNYGLSKFQIMLKIIIPASLPHILAGLRSGFGSAWRTLIGAEMLVVSLGGLGKYIWYAQWYYEFDRVFAGLVTIAVIGLLVEKLFFNTLEKITVCRWGMVRHAD